MATTFELAENAVRERLSESGFAHSVGVSEMAGALALVYSSDVNDACLAGLLHDWDRERDRGELVDAARAAGVEVADLDQRQPRLLHAATGAAQLAELIPGLSPEVISAVSRHTLGAVEMSDLDKIVYVADMIEPGRDFEGVDDLREAVGNVSLDALFALCYRHTLLYLVREGLPIHPATVDVWNALVARGGE